MHKLTIKKEGEEVVVKQAVIVYKAGKDSYDVPEDTDSGVMQEV